MTQRESTVDHSVFIVEVLNNSRVIKLNFRPEMIGFFQMIVPFIGNRCRHRVCSLLGYG